MDDNVGLAGFLMAFELLYGAMIYSKARECLFLRSLWLEMFASKRVNHGVQLHSSKRMLIAGMVSFALGNIFLAFLPTAVAYYSLAVFGLCSVVGCVFVADATKKVGEAHRTYLHRIRLYRREQFRVLIEGSR